MKPEIDYVVVYIKPLQESVKRSFKRECAVRGISMIDSIVEFMRFGRELMPKMRIPTNYNHNKASKGGTSNIYFRPVPRHIHTYFKGLCAERGVTMTTVLVAFMRQAKLMLPQVQCRTDANLSSSRRET